MNDNYFKKLDKAIKQADEGQVIVLTEEMQAILLNQKVEPELIYFFDTASIEEIEKYWALFNNKNK